MKRREEERERIEEDPQGIKRGNFNIPPPPIMPPIVQQLLKQDSPLQPRPTFPPMNIQQQLPLRPPQNQMGFRPQQNNDMNNGFFQGPCELNDNNFSRPMGPRMQYSPYQHPRGNRGYGRRPRGRFYGPNTTRHQNPESIDSGQHMYHQNQWNQQNTFQVPPPPLNNTQQPVSRPQQQDCMPPHMARGVASMHPPPVMPTSSQQAPVPPPQQPAMENMSRESISLHRIPVVPKVEEVIKSKSNKRRPMSQSYPSRPWNEEDAVRAYNEEMEHSKSLQQQSLIIRFPDPELNKDIVKQFNENIENVHFQVPSGARYCFVQLKDSANVEKTIQDLQRVQFNGSNLTVEKKFSKAEEEVSPKEIDPYTLYIGNLPPNVNIQCVKEKFPTAARIDIGFAQRMKFTRYAFIRYNNVDDSIQAYRDSHNLVLESRSIIVRFRRHRGQIGLPGEPKPRKSAKEKGKKKKDVKIEELSATDVLERLKDLEKRVKKAETGDGKSKKVEEDDDDEKDDDDDDEDDDDDDDAEEDDDDSEEEEEEEEEEEDDDDGNESVMGDNKPNLLSQMQNIKGLEFSFF